MGGSGKRKKPRQDFGGADDEFGDDEDPFYEQAAEAAQHKKSARKDKCAAPHGVFARPCDWCRAVIWTLAVLLAYCAATGLRL